MTDDFLTSMELEERIKDFSPESQFLAREVCKIQKVCPSCQRRLAILEGREKAFLGVVGGSSGLLGGAIVALIEFLRKL